MNGKTSKLIRRAAVYVKLPNGKPVLPETKYVKKTHPHSGSITIKMAVECERLAAKVLKKHYRRGDFTTDDLREFIITGKNVQSSL